MPEEKEKVEDFISLWRKKMIDNPQKPGIVGETIDRMRELDEENKKLRTKIAENIDLISRTEDIVKKTIEENTRLKDELNQGSSTGVNQINDLQKKNLDLSNRIKSLVSSLKEKDNVISVKDNELGIRNNELTIKTNEITELNLKLNEAKSALEFIANTNPEDNTEISKDLIEELQLELSKKKSQVNELEVNIEELNTKIVTLNEQLIEKEKKSPVDYVIPVETPKPQVIRPQPAQTSSTLELLCQDLQADLNKYKRIIDNLTKEKSELEATLESSGSKLEPGEIIELKKENDALRTELTQLQETLQAKPKATPQSLSLVEAERLIEDLQEQLKLKDKLIIESKSSYQPQIITPKGPMSGLVGELQNNINKLKIALEEKNNIIEKLKSS
ncbi:MAG: hypothetical protein ACXAAH_12385 [Promethearchaeota archaeon]|jgi:chromosome segregation ATPase